MKIHNKKELFNYIENCDKKDKKKCKLSSIYYLIKIGDNEFPVYFMPFEDVYFESECVLIKNPATRKDVVEYVKEMYPYNTQKEALKYELTMFRNGFHYQIDCPQCFPFLPQEIDDIKVISEIECLDWLIKKEHEII